MNRYIVFALVDFYPVGGMHDAIDSFEDEESAIQCAEGQLTTRRIISCHVFDCDTRSKVWEQKRDY
jgi:hypothetical protein